MKSRSPRTIALLAAAAVAAVGLVGSGVGVATAGGSHPATTLKPASTPVSDKQIPNLGLVENRIEAYYGDTVVGTEHYASPASNYAKQVRGIETRIESYLTWRSHVPSGKKQAIVLDVDDTTLLTYNYETEQGFGYTPDTNAAYVEAEKMSAVFGMPTLANRARRHGYTVFFVTGRPVTQRDATAGNLAKVGYRVPTDVAHLYLKDKTNPPAYLPCGATCTTIQYKSGTRAHIESLGYRIVADVGDQYSDLKGGHTDRTYKIPNPMYYLP